MNALGSSLLFGPLLGGYLSAQQTREATRSLWYSSMNKPRLTPPNWVGLLHRPERRQTRQKKL